MKTKSTLAGNKIPKKIREAFSDVLCYRYRIIDGKNVATVEIPALIKPEMKFYNCPDCNGVVAIEIDDRMFEGNAELSAQCIGISDRCGCPDIRHFDCE